MHLLLVLSTTLPAAPAPLPSPPPPITPADVAGLWRLDWAGSPWTARFCPDGFYAGWCGQSVWLGSWRLDGHVLTVRERPAAYWRPSSGWESTWRVQLGRDRHGRIDGRGATVGSAVPVRLSCPSPAGR